MSTDPDDRRPTEDQEQEPGRTTSSRPGLGGLGDALRESIRDAATESVSAGLSAGAAGLSKLDGLGERIRTNVEDALGTALGPTALRGLSHPLRVKILDLLTTHGSLTASRLGELLGESSGSTSYHLRQLAKHGFVREVEGKGTARERWWETVPGSFSVMPDPADDAGTRMAKDLVNAEFERSRQEKIWALLRRMNDRPGEHPEWERAATLSTINVWATPEQLERLVAAVHATLQEQTEALRNQKGAPGTRPVQIHFNAFPVVGAGDAEH
ncbi:helix-turn-helix domain-containing protein [Isoptericola variabilis]|uniref:Regulatory protein ArsR n=1 Tax=Isoptericola variabilis (strain 225) TaxID=743718 RepID=F6FSN8_ISOV2|nr:helix-turn-helix domain-containing protein [Isoptericola variabilis]AEG45200.1 regulatory protein ArsR [Isoptericola variabilis 225]TWH33986.1 putative transcriptional regulators [Isoptericola variabilis J7]